MRNVWLLRGAILVVGVLLAVVWPQYSKNLRLARYRQMDVCTMEAKEAVPGVDPDGHGPDWERLKDHAELCMLKAGYHSSSFRATCRLGARYYFQADCYMGDSYLDRVEMWWALQVNQE
jgi:hypothetical protein